MINTNSQPYVSWKGTNTNALTYNNVHPLAGGNSNLENFTSAHGKARPLKHWRKQLTSNYKTGRSAISIDQINKPGGFVYLGVASTDCATCNDSSYNNNYFKVPIETTKNNDYTKNAYKLTDEANNIFGKCINYHQDTFVTKPSTTNISKKYFASTQSYLQSRCLSYQQKLSIHKKDGVTYLDASGNPLHPNDSSTGPQVFNTSNCPIDCTAPNNHVTTIYKRSNTKFAVDGAVSSSTRLERLKYDTVTLNGNSFRTAYGEAGANAGKYHRDGFTPYFTKNKVASCVNHHVNGKKTKCFNLTFS